jgi:uncharacterized protein (DUF433 family)
MVGRQAVLLEDYFDFVGPTEIRLKGHRIGIEHVLAYYQQGYTPEAIAQEFPGLGLERIYATITYYLHNRAAVDAYLDRLAALVAEGVHATQTREPPAVVQRLRALKEQRLQDQTV